MQSIYPAVFIWLAFGIAASYLAKNRGRNPLAWFFIGLTLGLLGLLLLFLLPKVESQEQAQTATTETFGQAEEVHSEAALPSDDSPPAVNMKRLPRNPKLEWFCIDLDAEPNIVGPMKMDELRTYIHKHEITETTHVWCSQMDEWTLISDCSNASILLDTDYLEN